MLLLPQTSLLRALHTAVRDKNASGRDFEIYSRRIIRLLLEAGLDLLPFEKREVTTPVGETYHGLELPGHVCGVSVVRAGESMEAELREMVPGIRIGKILIQRDKRTKQPELFYKHLPGDIHTGHVLLMEPMLATGGSALAALDVLREAGVRDENVVLINFLASPTGLERFGLAAPDVKVVTSAVEDGMNENAFMVPGIGDFGDRFFGTVPAAAS
ncbi:uracil phosphoribosyltransferase [Streptomyces sp. SID8356]|uniref:uracil phosphoribosyltransferase n=1 Tax=unclassified Streptomyces TaxID=2593676 RepID=UPI0003773157|nr:uracil phosphoribosyltransferase [Streptomyces sp. CcalMP-8W]MYT35167.1 uracil phosphoribosyltransferase [Streptomyces sp. SID8356]